MYVDSAILDTLKFNIVYSDTEYYSVAYGLQCFDYNVSTTLPHHTVYSHVVQRYGAVFIQL